MFAGVVIFFIFAIIPFIDESEINDMIILMGQVIPSFSVIAWLLGKFQNDLVQTQLHIRLDKWVEMSILSSFASAVITVALIPILILSNSLVSIDSIWSFISLFMPIYFGTLGFAQWRALRNQSNKALEWIVANSVGAILFSLFYILVLRLNLTITDSAIAIFFVISIGIHIEYTGRTMYRIIKDTSSPVISASDSAPTSVWDEAI